MHVSNEPEVTTGFAKLSRCYLFTRSCLHTLVLCYCCVASLSPLLGITASAAMQEARRHESQIARLSLTSKDCNNLMPGEPPDDQARIKALTEESRVLEEELIEVEAKNRLYTLLGERTR